MKPPSLHALRILLADDHTVVRMGFRLLLEGAGASVVGEADCGEAAVCDELRGGMDASQYKDYVLVLLFVKYVSDKYAGRP
jgi:CheY-like chemotaxis protein